MNDVVAVVEREETRERLLRFAHAVGEMLGLSVRTVDHTDKPPEECPPLAEESGVAAFVMVTRDGPSAHCWQVMQEVAHPVLLLPDSAVEPRPEIKAALLPVEGLEPDPVAVRIAHVLSGRGVDVVALHVFDERTVPPFWDQAAHAGEPWRHEFVRRHVPEGASLELRRGPTGAELVAEARRREVDLVVLVWSQHLEADRAQTVRHVVNDGSVPVLLLTTRSGLLDLDTGSGGPTSTSPTLAR